MLLLAVLSDIITDVIGSRFVAETLKMFLSCDPHLEGDGLNHVII